MTICVKLDGLIPAECFDIFTSILIEIVTDVNKFLGAVYVLPKYFFSTLTLSHKKINFTLNVFVEFETPCNIKTIF